MNNFFLTIYYKMSKNISFDIASGKYNKMSGGMYSRTRVDRQMGSGIGSDILASIVESALPKVVSLLADAGSKKLATKIRGSGCKRKGGSYRLR
jgi:hypothetical protein